MDSGEGIMRADPATTGLSGAGNLREAPAGASGAIHCFAWLTAGATLCLLIAGALVVGHDAGLAVPDWPLSFGTWMPLMEGGVFYEHGHRMIAATVGLLTTVLAVWLGWKDPRPRVKQLAALAWVAVIVQAILGGLTVLYRLPVPILIAHACLAQIFFCLILSLVLLTSPAWERAAAPAETILGAGLESLAKAATGTLFLQLALGAALRHKALGVAPHAVGAVIAGFLVGLLCYRAVTELGERDDIRRLARWVGGILALQLLLGVVSYTLREAPPGLAPQNWVVLLTTAHVAVGALLLGSTLILTLLAYRRLAASGTVRTLAGSPQRTLACVPLE